MTTNETRQWFYNLFRKVCVRDHAKWVTYRQQLNTERRTDIYERDGSAEFQTLRFASTSARIAFAIATIELHDTVFLAQTKSIQDWRWPYYKKVGAFDFLVCPFCKNFACPQCEVIRVEIKGA